MWGRGSGLCWRRGSTPEGLQVGQGEDRHHSVDPQWRDPLGSCSPAHGIGFLGCLEVWGRAPGSVMMGKTGALGSGGTEDRKPAGEEGVTTAQQGKESYLYCDLRGASCSCPWPSWPGQARTHRAHRLARPGWKKEPGV